MIAEVISLLLACVFLYLTYRFGAWIYVDPVRVGEKLFFYDRYLKPGKLTLGYFRTLGAFFCWFAIFGAGEMALSGLSSLTERSGAFLFSLGTVIWLIASFFVARKMRNQLKVTSAPLSPILPS